MENNKTENDSLVAKLCMILLISIIVLLTIGGIFTSLEEKGYFEYKPTYDLNADINDVQNKYTSALDRKNIYYEDIFIDTSKIDTNNKNSFCYFLVILPDSANYEKGWETLNILSNVYTDIFSHFGVCVVERVALKNSVYCIDGPDEFELNKLSCTKEDYINGKPINWSYDRDFSYITSTAYIYKNSIPFVGMDRKYINYTLWGKYIDSEYITMPKARDPYTRYVFIFNNYVYSVEVDSWKDKVRSVTNGVKRNYTIYRDYHPGDYEGSSTNGKSIVDNYENPEDFYYDYYDDFYDFEEAEEYYNSHKSKK